MRGEVTREVPEQKARGRILAYMAPPPRFVEAAPLHMRSALIVGEMGSGKTTFIEAKLGEAIRYLLGEGVDDNSICYVYGTEKGVTRLIKALDDLDISDYRYLYMFNDDAPAASGSHGRRALSKENVRESRAYVMIRHRLKSLGFRGFLFVAHASQVYHLVDITFRRMAVLKFFKTYPDEPADWKLLAPLVGSAGLAALHDLSMRLWTSNDPETTWQAVHRAVAVLKRWRALARADPEARRILAKIPQAIRIELKQSRLDQHSNTNNMSYYRAYVRLLHRLIESNMVTPNGNRIIINPSTRDYVVATSNIPPEILECCKA